MIERDMMNVKKIVSTKKNTTKNVYNTTEKIANKNTSE